MSTFEFISKDGCFGDDRERRQANNALQEEGRVYMIFDKEVTPSARHLTVYVYDSNSLKQSFENELSTRGEEDLPKVFSLCTTDKATAVNHMCHARSILVMHCNPHHTMFDCMSEKFPCFNTTSGLVTNREVD